MRVHFTIGTGYDRDEHAIPYAEATLLTRQAIRYITGHYGGCIAVEGDGAWNNEHGRTIEERSLLIIVEMKDDRWIESDARYLRRLFRQKSVVASVSPSVVKFITEDNGHERQVETHTETTQRGRQEIRSTVAGGV